MHNPKADDDTTYKKVSRILIEQLQNFYEILIALNTQIYSISSFSLYLPFFHKITLFLIVYDLGFQLKFAKSNCISQENTLICVKLFNV